MNMRENKMKELNIKLIMTDELYNHVKGKAIIGEISMDQVCVEMLEEHIRSN